MSRHHLDDQRVHMLAQREGRADVTDGAPVELTVAFTDLAGLHHLHRGRGRRCRPPAADRSPPSSPAAIVRSRGGRVLKRLGDGLMLIFPEPEAAVLACLELGEAAPLPTAGGHPRRQGAGDRRRRHRSCGEPGGPRDRVRGRRRAGRHRPRANSSGRPARRRLRRPIHAELQGHRREGAGVSSASRATIGGCT